MFLQCGSWGRCRHSVGRREQDCSAYAFRAEKIGSLSTICYNLITGIQLAFRRRRRQEGPHFTNPHIHTLQVVCYFFNLPACSCCAFICSCTF